MSTSALLMTAHTGIADRDRMSMDDPVWEPDSLPDSGDGAQPTDARPPELADFEPA